jgi:hypothetical protein
MDWGPQRQRRISAPRSDRRSTGLRASAQRCGLRAAVVVDTTQVAGYTIGSIADYVSMAVLSLVQSPDHCDALPSILDLMSSSCHAREPPSGITAGDVAFLKALYYHNTGLGPSLSRDDIQSNMMRQFKGQAAADKSRGTASGGSG